MGLSCLASTIVKKGATFPLIVSSCRSLWVALISPVEAELRQRDWFPGIMPLKWGTAGKWPLPELCDRSKKYQVQSWKYRASSCLSTNFWHNIEQILCSSKKLVPKGEYTSVYSAAKTTASSLCLPFHSSWVWASQSSTNPPTIDQCI